MSKIRIVVSTLIAGLVLAGGLWWLLKPGEDYAPVVAVATKPATVPSKASQPAAVVSVGKNFPASKPASQASEIISTIIASPNADNSSIVDQLFTVLPSLSGPEQAEAAEHIANLSDDKIAERWIPDVVAWKLPAPAAEVLYKNLSNRSPAVTMPALAAMADNPNHPKQQSSIDILGVLYDAPAQGSTWSAVVREQAQSKLASSPGQ